MVFNAKATQLLSWSFVSFLCLPPHNRLRANEKLLFTSRKETCNEDPSSRIPSAGTPGIPSFYLRGQKEGAKFSTPRGAPKGCHPTPVLLWFLKLVQDILCLPPSPPLPAILQLCPLGSCMAGRHDFIYRVWAPYSHSVRVQPTTSGFR